MSSQHVTRGNGTLEGWLAKRRCFVANKLIPTESRQGRLLDIGCGTFPYFLLHTDFFEKHGIDKTVDVEGIQRLSGKSIILKHYDVERETVIPFDNHYFDVITMLAVLEHLEPKQVIGTLIEARRMLKPGGLFIATTPATWSDGLLKIMAKMGLVSAEEILEHKATYTHQKLRHLLHSAQYVPDSIQCGYFELYLNLWITGRK